MATDAPSVKGTLFANAVRDLETLIEAGRLSPEQLEAELEPDDHAQLAEKIQPVLWYPIESYARLVDLSCRVEFDGTREGYRELGRRAARAVIDAGVYAQVNATRAVWGERAGVVMTSLAASVYNFTRWSWHSGESDGAVVSRIEVEDAAAFPDCIRFRAEGFIEVLMQNTSGGKAFSVVSERPARDRIVYTTRRQGA